MNRNPQAVLDVLEFYSENLLSRKDTYDAPSPLSRSDSEPVPLNSIRTRERASSLVPNTRNHKLAQSSMNMRVRFASESNNHIGHGVCITLL